MAERITTKHFDAAVIRARRAAREIGIDDAYWHVQQGSSTNGVAWVWVLGLAGPTVRLGLTVKESLATIEHMTRAWEIVADSRNVSDRALRAWQDARPVAAMRLLAEAGYDSGRRAEWLRDVAGVEPAEIAAFAADSYIAEDFDCYTCGAASFTAEEGTTHHKGDGPTGIDHDKDADHVALDPNEVPVIRRKANA